MESPGTQTRTAEARPASEPRIVSTPGTCGGKPRIDGHRITVKHVVLCHQRDGRSADDIVSDYPSLTLADTYAALAYYHAHRDEIDADIKADDDHWAELERQDPGRLADRLQRRKADVQDHPLPFG